MINYFSYNWTINNIEKLLIKTILDDYMRSAMLKLNGSSLNSLVKTDHINKNGIKGNNNIYLHYMTN